MKGYKEQYDTSNAALKKTFVELETLSIQHETASEMAVQYGTELHETRIELFVTRTVACLLAIVLLIGTWLG